MPATGFTIRPYEPKDEDAVYEVCLKTGDAGRDATLLYSDPKALGHIYVGPYLHLDPQLAFVLKDPQGICGYALGARDSAEFYHAYLNRWLPEVRKRYPEPAGDPNRWTPTEEVFHEYYHPQIYFPEAFHAYPSHLHIDLLPRAQGQGHGQRMIETLLDRLKILASLGAHLAMAATNSRAERFYKKLGFTELARTGVGERQTLYLGRRL